MTQTRYPRRQSPRAWSESLGLRELERSHDYPAGLLEALIYVESRGDSHSNGDGGRSDGLFQIMGSTGGAELRRLGGREFRNFTAGLSPETDARAAARLLEINHEYYLDNRYGDTPNLAAMVAAYNAGAPRIERRGFNAVSSTIYRHSNGTPGYVPSVVAYLRLNGFSESADALMEDVRELAARGEVDMARFEREVAHATTQHREQIRSLNGSLLDVRIPEDQITRLREIAGLGAQPDQTAVTLARRSDGAYSLLRNLEAAGLATDAGGADGQVDGVIGGNARDAIRVVEQVLGLRQDGRPDAAVIAALEKPRFREALRASLRGETEQPANDTPAQEGGSGGFWQQIGAAIMSGLRALFPNSSRTEQPAAPAPATEDENRILAAFNQQGRTPVDLRNDPETNAAVRALQEALDTGIDGIVGYRTRDAFRASTRIDTNGDDVLSLEELRAFQAPRPQAGGDRQVS